MTYDDVELQNCILCDDVRREDNGRYVLIGCYTAEPTIYEAPKVVDFSVFCSFRFLKQEDATIYFLVEGPRFRGRGAVPWEAGSAVVADVIVPFNCLVEAEGVLSFSWWLEGKPVQRREWRVTLAPEATIVPQDQADAIVQAYQILNPGREARAVLVDR